MQNKRPSSHHKLNFSILRTRASGTKFMACPRQESEHVSINRLWACNALGYERTGE